VAKGDTIWNLEFPSWCDVLTIGGYRFERIDGYEEALKSLHRTVAVSYEFQLDVGTGGHAQTAVVHRPAKECGAVLDWQEKDATELDDILLLLTLLTSRDVFCSPREINGAVTCDPRIHQYGHVLRTALPRTMKSVDPAPNRCWIGLEEGLNAVHDLVRDPEWRAKHGGGYFLFLLRQAVLARTIESAFIQYWTILEHLFAVLHGPWMSDRQIQQLEACDKMCFFLVEYALASEIEEKGRQRIRELVRTRNRLVHNGRFPEKSTANADAVLFTELAEFVVAKILGLAPTELFNTMERFEKFLTRAGEGG